VEKLQSGTANARTVRQPPRLQPARGRALRGQRPARPFDELRTSIEQLARYITRPAISNGRLSINCEGNAVLKLKPVLSLTKERPGATPPRTTFA
jgi:Putative transposase